MGLRQLLSYLLIALIIAVLYIWYVDKGVGLMRMVQDNF